MPETNIKDLVRELRGLVRGPFFDMVDFRIVVTHNGIVICVFVIVLSGSCGGCIRSKTVTTDAPRVTLMSIKPGTTRFSGIDHLADIKLT